MENHRFFSLYTRRGILYVRFKPHGSRRWGSGHSTGFGENDRSGAEFAVRAYLDGIRPTFFRSPSSTLPLTPDHVDRVQTLFSERKLLVERGRVAPPLIAFLEEFWDYDKSKYVERQLATGHRMSRRHCYDQTKHVQNHWKKYFADKTIAEVRLTDLEDFSSYLRTQGLKGKTINNITDAGTIGLGWCFERGLITANPTVGFVRAAVDSDKRGVLTPDEVRQLFDLEWPDERARLGNLLACSCDLRSGVTTYSPTPSGDHSATLSFQQ